jgi:signal transduction histidine kinase
MLDGPPASTRLAPEWAARLLLAFIVLSLAALIVIPWATARHLRPLQDEMNRLADPGRGLVTQIHLHMAQEGSALDDYVDDRDSLSMRRFEEAASRKRAAYAALRPIVSALGTVPRQRLAELLSLEDRWHRAVEANVLSVPRSAELRHDPVQEDLYDDMLIAAARLDEAITQAGRDRRDLIAQSETFQQHTSALLGLLALTSALATWRLSRRVRIYALEAEERREALAEVVASRARFMRGVSHDLKNPIHAIDGHAQLLEDGLRGPLTDEQRESVARIRRSTRALTGLIEDLLELARAESGQLTVKLDRVLLRDVVRDAVEEHRAAAEFAGLTLAHAADESETILTTDPARVSQVLGNLISNAIKYTPRGGHIEVATEMLARRAADGGAARLAIHVTDDGPGIPADKYEEIFGEFTRLQVVDKPGTGLGLSIARRIARLLGGDVTVSGRQNGGARFTLWLPVRSTA